MEDSKEFRLFIVASWTNVSVTYFSIRKFIDRFNKENKKEEKEDDDLLLEHCSLFHVWYGMIDVKTFRLVQDYSRIIANSLGKKFINSERGQAILKCSETLNVKQITDIIHRLVIENRKKIKKKVRTKIWDKLPTKILTQEEKIEIIEKLMKMDSIETWKKAIPLNLCRFCYMIENAIVRFAKLEPQQESLLMNKFHEFLYNLGTRRQYENLSRPSKENIKYILITRLPNVLARIVIDYCALSVHDVSDYNEILSRMLLLTQINHQ